jgi:hypothetical protein
MNESFKVYALYMWGGMGLVSALIAVLRVKNEIFLASFMENIPRPKLWHHRLRRNAALLLVVAARAFLEWPILLVGWVRDKGFEIAARRHGRSILQGAILVQPDEKTLEVMSATRLPAHMAERFIRSAPPDLIQRLLDRHATRLSDQPWDQSTLSREGILHDPLEDDPVVGLIIRSVLKECQQDMTAQHGHQLGLCHRIWHETQRRLLRDHSIVWFTPGQVNPWCRFD